MSKDSKKTILCVDDEQDILDSLFDELMDDYHVLSSTNPIKALKYFDKYDIALVISDQRMPEMTGSDFLAKVHKIKPICKKILLTGYSDINAAIDAINLGSVDKYFSKPWDSDELLAAIESLLSMYKMDAFFERVISQGKDMKATIQSEVSRSKGFQEFLDNYFQPMCLLDEAACISYINKKGVELFKYSEPEIMLGQNFLEEYLVNIKPQEFVDQYIEQDNPLERLTVKASDGTIHSLPVKLVCKEEDIEKKLCGIVFNVA